jgi:hypothetical protein
VVPLYRFSTLESSSTFLVLQSVSNGGGDDCDNSSKQLRNKHVYEGVDWKAVLTYFTGLVVQTTLIAVVLANLDKGLTYFDLPKKIPLVVHFFFLYAFNLKIPSLLSILPLQKGRDQKLTQDKWEYNKRNKPSWTPPGIAFVLGWPLLTFGLRAWTGAMIVQQMGGRYASRPILSLMFHLGFGNLWNTVCVLSDG